MCFPEQLPHQEALWRATQQVSLIEAVLLHHKTSARKCSPQSGCTFFLRRGTMKERERQRIIKWWIFAYRRKALEGQSVQRNIPVESLLGPCCFSHLSLVTESRVKCRTQAKIKSHIIAHFNIVKKLHFRGPRSACFPQVYAHLQTSASWFICLGNAKASLAAPLGIQRYLALSTNYLTSTKRRRRERKYEIEIMTPRVTNDTSSPSVYRKSGRNTNTISHVV